MPRRSNVDSVEFGTLKDLFCFVMANSTVGQQILSVMRFKQYTYTVASRGDSITIFFTKDEPKAPVYVCDADIYDFLPVKKQTNPS